MALAPIWGLNCQRDTLPLPLLLRLPTQHQAMGVPAEDPITFLSTFFLLLFPASVPMMHLAGHQD